MSWQLSSARSRSRSSAAPGVAPRRGRRAGNRQDAARGRGGAHAGRPRNGRHRPLPRVRRAHHLRAATRRRDGARRRAVAGRARRRARGRAARAPRPLWAALGTGEAGGSREEILWAVRRLLELAACLRPIAVVIDDLHCAEPTFLDMLEHVASQVAGPLLLLCAARPELLEQRPAWAAGGALELEPLSAEHSAALLSSLGVDDPRARQRLLDSAEGNPLVSRADGLHAGRRRRSGAADAGVAARGAARAARARRARDHAGRGDRRQGVHESRRFARSSIRGREPVQPVTLTAFVARQILRSCLAVPSRARAAGRVSFDPEGGARRTARAARPVGAVRGAARQRRRDHRLPPRAGLSVPAGTRSRCPVRRPRGPSVRAPRGGRMAGPRALRERGLRRPAAHPRPGAARRRRRAHCPPASRTRPGAGVEGRLGGRGGRADQRRGNRGRRMATLPPKRAHDSRSCTCAPGCRGAPPRELEPAVERALAVFEQVGEPRDRAEAYWLLAFIRRYQGRSREAATALRRSARHAREGRILHAEDHALMRLSMVAVFGPAPIPEAREELDAILVGAQGRARRQRGGRAPGARHAAGVRRPLRRRHARSPLAPSTTSPSSAPRCRPAGQSISIDRCWIELIAEEFATAERMLRPGCATFERLGAQRGLVTHLGLLAHALHGQGRHAEAVGHALAAERLVGPGDRWAALAVGARAKSLAGLGRTRRGHPRGARRRRDARPHRVAVRACRAPCSTWPTCSPVAANAPARLAGWRLRRVSWLRKKASRSSRSERLRPVPDAERVGRWSRRVCWPLPCSSCSPRAGA